jgi:hypothetical protein
MMDFQGKDREEEVIQWRERFQNSMSFYEDVFQSKIKALDFINLYTQEAGRSDIPMFYNKFIIKGKKI